MRGESAGHRLQEVGQGVALGKDGGGRVGQRAVGGALGEAFGELAQGTAGVICFDHAGVRRSVPGPGTPLDEGVQVRSGQPGRLGPGGLQNTAEPDRGLAVLVDGGHGSGAHRREQGAMGMVTEVLRCQRAEPVQTLGFEEEGSEQGLLGVVYRGRRMHVRQLDAIVGAGYRHVGHQAAKAKSSGPRGRPRCEESR